MSIEPTKIVSSLALAIGSSLCTSVVAQELPQRADSATVNPVLLTEAGKDGATQPATEAADPASALPPGKPGGTAGTAGATQQIIPPPEPDLMGGTVREKPSQSGVINLINRMVKKGLLTSEEAAELVAQAGQDAIIARSQARDDAQIAAQMVIQQAVEQKVIPSLEPSFASSDEGIRIPYIPDTVKKQIKDDLRQEVLSAAKEQNWTLPKGMPEWVSRFRVKGDIRIRSEFDSFPEGNDNTGAFPNFNAINTGQPFDVAGTVFSPQLNVDQDRTRFRLRVRAGAEVEMGEGWTANLRIATGQNNSPVSVNQSLGFAGQQQGGNFSKYAIWLDRAFLRYELGVDPDRHLNAFLGRFENPFFGARDVMWDDDLGFDGIAFSARYAVKPGFTPFIAGGAFPVFNTDFNFASNQPGKFRSTDKYLYGGEIGADLKPLKDLDLKFAGAYYYFDGVEGRKSTPFTPLSIVDQGDTDEMRPSFAQKGNTYMALRDIVPDASNAFGTINQWQYFGLAPKFRPLVGTARLTYNGFEPVQVSLTGDYVRNLGFDHADIESKAVNNRGPVSTANPAGNFEGGDVAWLLGLRSGHAALERRGNWQAGINYRHVESDAVVDGFADSVFGFGGTNVKGFTLWGTLATSARTSLTFRWLSASEIAGPPLRSDIFMIDFSGRF